MRKSILLAALLLVLAAMPAFSMTGTPVNGEPADNPITFTSLTEYTAVHDETVDNPLGWYKGWWWTTLTNNTASDWSSVTIKAGQADLVAIVQGNGLADEWGFTGNSVVVNRAATLAYTGYLGDRTYENGAYGLLWTGVTASFATPVAANGGKVSFKVYTDNSYYQGPWASSFCLCLTPTPVPEPSSILALASGLLGIVGIARRKRS